MIECRCIDDKNRPSDLPLSKWVKEEEKYHITFVTLCLPQKVFGYSLYEKPLGPECSPYEYFISTRFAVKKEDIEKIIQLYNDIAGVALSETQVKEILENSNLQTA